MGKVPESNKIKKEIKIDHVVKNQFYFTIFWACLPNKIETVKKIKP